MKVPILLPNIFNHAFTYDSGNMDLNVGDYVLIPFGKSKVTGVVWDKFEEEKNKKFLLKKVISKLNITPLNKNIINQCFENDSLEEWILNSRISAQKKYDIRATPTIIINATINVVINNQ